MSDAELMAAVDQALTPIVQAMLAERDELITDMIAAAQLPNPHHFLLYGAPGTGKSSIAHLVAKILGKTDSGENIHQPVTAVQCSDKRSGQALLEMMTVEQGSMRTILGPGAQAWQDGGILVLEEADRMSMDMVDVAHMLLVRGMGARVTLMDGRVLRPHPDFRAILTMNGLPTDLPEAIQDRTLHVPVRCPSSDMIKALGRTLDPNERRGLRTACLRVYAAFATHKVADPSGDAPLYTYREFQHFSELYPILGADKAALYATGDKERAERFGKMLRFAMAPAGSGQTHAA